MAKHWFVRTVLWMVDIPAIQLVQVVGLIGYLARSTSSGCRPPGKGRGNHGTLPIITIFVPTPGRVELSPNQLFPWVLADL